MRSLPELPSGPTKTCQTKNDLPDPQCTPGVTNPLALFVFSFNFREIHRSIRCTPAMAAGVANTIWTWADLFAN
jgi:hypothetical protein